MELGDKINRMIAGLSASIIIAFMYNPAAVNLEYVSERYLRDYCHRRLPDYCPLENDLSRRERIINGIYSSPMIKPSPIELKDELDRSEIE